MKTLTPRWLFQHGVIDGVSNQTTPVIVDGDDVRDRFARQRLRASTPPTATCCGRSTSPKLIGGGAREGYIFRNRGVAYADGVVYTAAGSFLLRARREDRQADSELRHERTGAASSSTC